MRRSQVIKFIATVKQKQKNNGNHKQTQTRKGFTYYTCMYACVLLVETYMWPLKIC